jgi:molybdopterin-containing oxidoreductase family iron-sulfur binding subunit
MGMLWNRVISTDAETIDGSVGTYPYLSREYRPLACQHCENPPCQAACPVGATYTDDEGRVLIDYDLCIGCRICMSVCPYNARVFNWEEPVRSPDFNYGHKAVPVRQRGVTEKCTLCKERAADCKEPICVVCCPTRARSYGDLDDPQSSVSTLVRERDAQQLLAEKSTSPKVYYCR